MRGCCINISFPLAPQDIEAPNTASTIALNPLRTLLLDPPVPPWLPSTSYCFQFLHLAPLRFPPCPCVYPQDIEALNIASKDTTRSAMDMWATLLCSAPPTKPSNSSRAAGAGLGAAAGWPGAARKRPLGGGRAAGRGGGLGDPTAELLNLLQDFGDYDLVGGGT